MDDQLMNVMETTYACLKACNHCYDACLKEEDIDMVRDCIRTDRDCAEICAVVLSFSGREEAISKELLMTCAASCESCGKECEKHKHMEHCQKCADACFECAEACKTYVLA